MKEITLMEAWSKEVTSTKHKPSLHTLNQDSKAIAKLKPAFEDDGARIRMGEKVRVADDQTAEPQNTQNPMPDNKRKSPFTNAPMCGAFARQAGKPCQQVAMKGKERCRLHGGKSTGRPINDGLRTQEYKKHKVRLGVLTSMILHG